MRAMPLKEGVKPMQMDEYETLVARLLKQKSLPPDPATAADISVRYDERMRIRALTARIFTESSIPISIQSLETAWALSGRNNISDLTKWMER
jgi:hypothetical protein